MPRPWLRLLGLVAAVGLTVAAPSRSRAAADEPAAGGGWPSLEEQLARDHVPAGSALARLIAANQDLRLLAPAERGDKWHLPPWVRIYWRRHHPARSGEPAGAYPLALRDVYEWMVEHPDLPSPTLVAEQQEPSKARPTTSVGPDFNISGDGLFPRAESAIRIDPWNPSRIVAASNPGGRGGGLPIFVSTDGGNEWSQTVLPNVDSFHSDPAVEWTSDGTAWAVAIGVNGDVLKLRSFFSTDGGATWSADTTISGEQTAADRQTLWADHGPRSRFRDHLYAIWHDGAPVFFARRTPDGAWSPALQLSGGETRGSGIFADVKSDASGQLFAFWHDTDVPPAGEPCPPGGRIFLRRSGDGGATFDGATQVATTFQPLATTIPAQGERNATVYPSAGAFLKGKKTQLYVAWADLSGEPGCRLCTDDPFLDGTLGNPSCKTRIWFTRSLDGGRNWAPPRKLNDQPGENDQFNPALAVDETSGTLGLVYYDTVGEERTRANVYFQASFDGGLKWTPPQRVSSAASDATGHLDSFQYGDYNSLSALAGAFLPSWTDYRGTKAEIWSAPIKARRKQAVRPPD